MTSRDIRPKDQQTINNAYETVFDIRNSAVMLRVRGIEMSALRRRRYLRGVDKQGVIQPGGALSYWTKQGVNLRELALSTFGKTEVVVVNDVVARTDDRRNIRAVPAKPQAVRQR